MFMQIKVTAQHSLSEKGIGNRLFPPRANAEATGGQLIERSA
jgi:hypothetical protein